MNAHPPRKTPAKASSASSLAPAVTAEVASQAVPGSPHLPIVGSLFWFSARLKKGTPAAMPLMSMRPAETVVADGADGANKGRVLVVDDEPMNLEVAQLLLQAAGFSVDIADNGTEALRMVQLTPYAVILMDMQMPEMDGIETTRRLRQLSQQRGERQPCIIALTGNAFAEDKARCLAAGMNDFLPKPYLPDELYAAVRRGLAA